MKKLIAFLFVFFLIINLAYANQAENNHKLYLDDELLEFDKPLLIINNRLYAPAKQLAEEFDARVSWNKDLAAMVLFKERDQWMFFTREDLTYRNGRRYESDAQTIIIEGTSMLPVRFLGENIFEKEIKYDGQSKSTHIYSIKEEDNINKEEALLSTNIMGESIATAEEMADYLLKKNPSPKVSVSALKLATIYLEEGKKEGVRGDFAFAQSIIETASFSFPSYGAVSADQNNFCGLGATGKGTNGNVFESIEVGVRAQIQHLKGYASREELNQKLVDQRWFGNSKIRGSAPKLEFLAQALNPSGVGWAYPGYSSAKYKTVEEAFADGQTYGQSIHKIFLDMVG